MRKPQTLKGHLARLIIVLVVPFLGGALLATHHFAMAESARLEALAENLNQETALRIDREVTTRLAMLQAISSSSSIRNADNTVFEEEARDLAARTGVHVVLFDPIGQQLVNTGLPRGSPLPRTSDPNLVKEMADPAADAYVSNLFIGSATGEPLVLVALPIRRGKEVAAIIGSAISAVQLANLLRIDLPSDGPFFGTIVDGAGVIVASSESPSDFVGTPFPKLLDAARGSRGTALLTNPEGVEIFAQYRRPALSGWVVATAVTHDALRAPLTRSLELFALVAAALVAAACAGTWLIGRRLIGAHRLLAAAAVTVGEGRVISPSETGLQEADQVLRALCGAASSIAEHAAEMQRTNQQLEERVQFRTNEIAIKTALLQTTIDTMTQGLIVIDDDGRVPISNSQARELLELPDELMDSHPTLREILEFQDRRGEFASLPEDGREWLRLGPAHKIDVFECERPNGTVLEILTVPVPARGGFVRTFTNVTNRRRHARELETARDTAEQATRAKAEFLATMSHEMRTPLNAVIGYSERLLSQPDLSAEASRSAERIQNAAAALLALVDDILDLHKIEAGIIDMRSEPFSLKALIEDAVSYVRPAALARGLALNFRDDEGTEEFFLGDNDRLRQILLNLLGNAIKFTRAGRIDLSVELLNDGEKNQRLRFAVADTGIGIAPSELEAVFHRFHQAGPSVDGKFEGAGLGLAITKQLVERMGGSIHAESKPGYGSTFWFELTLEVARPLQSVPTNGWPCQSARILVAEDVVVGQELTRELLEAKGHQVSVVSNGRDAVEAVRAGRFEIVLMDLSMPELDGLDAARLIRSADFPVNATPIVACTANVTSERISALQAAGINAYLRKPLRRVELYATIDRLLAQRFDGSNQVVPEASDEGERDDHRDTIGLLGPGRIVTALDTLAGEMNSLIGTKPSDQEECRKLAERAHAIISTARALDFSELAEACRDLEDACLSGVGVGQAMERLRPVIASALDRSERLRRDIREYVSSSVSNPGKHCRA